MIKLGFNKSSIRFKMMGTFGLILLMLLGLGIVNFLQTNIVSHQVEDVSMSNLPLFKAVGDIELQTREQEGILLKAVISNQRSALGENVAEDDIAALKPSLEQLDSSIMENYATALTAANAALNRAVLDEDIAEYQMIVEHLEALQATQTQFNKDLLDAVTTLAGNNAQSALRRTKELMEEDGPLLLADLTSFVDHVRQLVDTNVTEIEQVQGFAGSLISGITIAIFVVVAAIFVAINFMILKQRLPLQPQKLQW